MGQTTPGKALPAREIEVSLLGQVPQSLFGLFGTLWGINRRGTRPFWEGALSKENWVFPPGIFLKNREPLISGGTTAEKKGGFPPKETPPEMCATPQRLWGIRQDTLNRGCEGRGGGRYLTASTNLWAERRSTKENKAQNKTDAKGESVRRRPVAETDGRDETMRKETDETDTPAAARAKSGTTQE